MQILLLLPLLRGPKSQYGAVLDGEIAMEVRQWIREDLDR